MQRGLWRTTKQAWPPRISRSSVFPRVWITCWIVPMYWRQWGSISLLKPPEPRCLKPAGPELRAEARDPAQRSSILCRAPGNSNPRLPYFLQVVLND